MPKDTGIGASTRRREDVRFLKGKGQYTDDIPPAHDQAAAVFARSTVANGVIKSIDTSVAESMPGVLAVFTGADFADVGGGVAWIETADVSDHEFAWGVGCGSNDTVAVGDG